jgi:VanZ family protein
MRSQLRPFLPLFILLIAGYWVGLFVLTHIPNVKLPDVDFIDKVCHCLGYGALAFGIGSVLTIWRGYQPRFPIWIWTLAVAYGAIDEYTQKFVENRSSDIMDLAADAVGAALGLLVLHLCVALVRRQVAQPQPAA